MMQYTVVWAVRLEKLIATVNSRIGEGWKPIGGMVMGNNDVYYQTMVKEL